MMGKLLSRVDMASPEIIHKFADISHSYDGIIYPGELMALNPWLYWQLSQGPPTAADSASATQVGCGGGHWGSDPLPPPNPGTWGANAQSIPGLLNDSRTALYTPGGSVPNGVAFSFSASADCPIWPPTNTWFHYTIRCTSNRIVNWQSWKIAAEIGTSAYIGNSVYTDGDTAVLVTQYSGPTQSVVWSVGTGPLPGQKKHLIVNLNANGSTSCAATLWSDGVNQGTQTLNFTSADGPATGYLGEGFTVGGIDGSTIQDAAIGGSNIAAGCAMTDAIASKLYSDWASLL